MIPLVYKALLLICNCGKAALVFFLNHKLNVLILTEFYDFADKEPVTVRVFRPYIQGKHWSNSAII